MSAIEHCPECEAAWERGHKAGRAFMVAQGHDTWKDMHAVVVEQKDALAEQLAGAVAALEACRAQAKQHKDAYLAMREENGIIRQQLRGAVDTLREARLYGEKMIRDRDETVRRCGADLLGIIDHDAGGQ
jgi:hypothetical protein